MAVRDHFAQVNAVLILVFFVLLGAVIGGRLAGVTSALTAAIAFDFFYTQPYDSLKINSAADVETTILLLLVGLAMGEIVVRADHIRFAVSGSRRELKSVHRVARLAADGESIEDLISAVSAELTETLGLHRCTYEAPPFTGSYPRLEQTGLITGTNVVQYTKQGFELPHEGVELPVVVHDQTVGTVRARPDPGSRRVDRRSARRRHACGSTERGPRQSCCLITRTRGAAHEPVVTQLHAIANHLEDLVTRAKATTADSSDSPTTTSSEPARSRQRLVLCKASTSVTGTTRRSRSHVAVRRPSSISR